MSAAPALSPVLTESWASGGFLVSEQPGTESRSVVTFDNSAGQADLLVEGGTVFAAMPAFLTAQTGPSNVGNGLATNLSASMLPGQIGTYAVTVGAGGSFAVVAPDGTVQRPGAAGVPYLDGIGFTLVQGSVPFTPGDGFALIVVSGFPPMDIPKAGNVGNGALQNLTGFTGAAASLGNYVATFSTPILTTFSVVSPAGVRLADGTVGAPYADQVGFTIVAGSTPFAMGDTFTLGVSPGPATVTAWDGSQTALGVIFSTVTVPAGAVLPIAAVVRNAEVAAAALRFPKVGAATAQATAQAQLRALGIVAR